jgi:hypothetical protein
MNEFENILEKIKSLAESDDPEVLSIGLNTAVQLLEDINDERNSLWLILDEMKKSEIENYSGEVENIVDRRLAHIKLLARLKPDLV